MTYNPESNVYVVERVVFFPAEGLVCPSVEDGDRKCRRVPPS